MDSDNDYGVPIPGTIVPPEAQARTAVKKLPPPGPLDWKALFGRDAPVVLDLGCGNGRFLISSALRRPEMNHLGLDILPLVIRYATKRANQRGLHNARLAVCGAREFLEQYVPPHSMQEIHLYHPQPYRDEALAYKRLITPEFLALAWRALVPEGLLILQTDNEGYWNYWQQVVPAFFEFRPRTTPWPDAPRGRTRREIYARQHHMEVYRAECFPRSDIGDDDLERICRDLPAPQFDARRKRSRKRKK